MLGIKDRKVLVLSASLLFGILIVYICIRMMPANRPLQQARHTAVRNESVADTRHEEALLSDALKKKPDHSPVLMRLAQMSSAAGKHNDAIRYLREILHREPANIDARLELGKALFESGDIQGAIAETDDILKEQPKHADGLYNLGAIYANLGDSARALEYWNQLIAAHPQSEVALRARNLIPRLPSVSSPIVANLDNGVVSKR